MLLIKHITLYDPAFQGQKDVLIAGGKIIDIADSIAIEGTDLRILDRKGYTMFPGLIDNHVHFTGGGGEAGYHSSVPEIMLADFIEAGITSAIGLLGTDGFTRSMPRLIAKAKALKHEGLSTYVLSGSYQVPVNTATGSIEHDMLLIEEIIGAGEIAISDHRSSQPTSEELKKIFASVHVGGLLSGKGGIFNLHVGSGKAGLQPLYDLLDTTDLSARKLLPTHMNRSEKLLAEAIQYSKTHQAPIDFTAYAHKDDDLSAYKAVARALKAGVALSHITMSSDGQGSLPVFDANGTFIKMGIGKVSALFDNLICGSEKANLSFETVLRTLTANVAERFSLKNKGYLKKDYDADMVIIDQNKHIHDVFMRGKCMMENKTIIHKGTFE